MTYAEWMGGSCKVPLGRRGVAKLGDRYAIYLPRELNDLWALLHDRKSKVKVYLYPRGELEGPLRELRATAFAARVTRASEGRFLIYLPVSQAPVWEEVHARSIGVDVILDPG
ncbi:MAG: hypothetical protein ACP5UD_08865 [Conexivisphaera sp.]